MNEKDKFYLENILDSILDIEKFIIKVNKTDFLVDELRQNAVIRKLEIIGEAAKRVSQETKNQSSGIEWKKVTGMRDILIHDYLGVDPEKVWATVTGNLPDLKKIIEQILSS